MIIAKKLNMMLINQYVINLSFEPLVEEKVKIRKMRQNEEKKEEKKAIKSL